MFAKNEEKSEKIELVNKDKSVSKKEKPKKLKKVELSNEDSNGMDSDDVSDLKGELDYCMPKPGPHAKSADWRKWKKMQRSIRQEREEKRILRLEQRQKEAELNAEANKNYLNKNNKGRAFTISIAVPGSIIGKVQSRELKTYVAGQIARAASIFCIDEIIVYNEYAMENKAQEENNLQLIKILEYLECPQYLRKTLFPPHRYLEHVGLLNALEAPHHFKLNDSWEYREGVSTDIPSKEDHGSWIDIGLLNKIQVDKKLKPGVRVTVQKVDLSNSHKFKGVVVSPETPRIKNGIYWGYQVRYASSFRKVLSESSFNEKYDLKIAINNSNANINFDCVKNLPKAKHVLISFGGLNGIDAAIESDEKLKAGKMDDIFDYICEWKDTEAIHENYFNYGSRTIRLEEALLISLAELRPRIYAACKSNQETSSKEEKNSDANDSDENENESE